MAKYTELNLRHTSIRNVLKKCIGKLKGRRMSQNDRKEIQKNIGSGRCHVG